MTIEKVMPSAPVIPVLGLVTLSALVGPLGYLRFGPTGGICADTDLTAIGDRACGAATLGV